MTIKIRSPRKIVSVHASEAHLSSSVAPVVLSMESLSLRIERHRSLTLARWPLYLALCLLLRGSSTVFVLLVAHTFQVLWQFANADS